MGTFASLLLDYSVLRCKSCDWQQSWRTKSFDLAQNSCSMGSIWCISAVSQVWLKRSMVEQ